MKYVLNEKGKKLYDIWEAKYDEELDKLRKKHDDPDYTEGWSIIEGIGETLEDYCGIEIFGDDDYAIPYVKNCIEDWGDFDWAKDIKASELLEELKKYYSEIDN